MTVQKTRSLKKQPNKPTMVGSLVVVAAAIAAFCISPVRGQENYIGSILLVGKDSSPFPFLPCFLFNACSLFSFLLHFFCSQVPYNFAPRYTASCNGQLLSIQSNVAL